MAEKHIEDTPVTLPKKEKKEKKASQSKTEKKSEK